jgi:hypothetical protein
VVNSLHVRITGQKELPYDSGNLLSHDSSLTTAQPSGFIADAQVVSAFKTCEIQEDPLGLAVSVTKWRQGA